MGSRRASSLFKRKGKRRFTSRMEGTYRDGENEDIRERVKAGASPRGSSDGPQARRVSP